MSLEYSIAIPARDASTNTEWVFIDAFHGVPIKYKVKTGSNDAPFNLPFASKGSLVRYYKWFNATSPKPLTPARQKKHAEILAGLFPDHAHVITRLISDAPTRLATKAEFQLHDRECEGTAPITLIDADKAHSAEAAALRAGPKCPLPMDEVYVFPAARDMQKVPASYDRRAWPKMIREMVGPDFRGYIESNEKGVASGRVFIWEDSEAGFKSLNPKATPALDTGHKPTGNTVVLHVNTHRPKAAKATAAVKRSQTPTSKGDKKTKTKTKPTPEEQFAAQAAADNAQAMDVDVEAQ